MAKYLYFWICSCAIVLFSCGDNSNEANAQYEKAQKLFENGQYANAKNAIDSIELLYPKAFKQIKAGMLLMCRVKQKESEQNLLYIDSVLKVRQTELEAAKKNFRFEKDAKYQTEGNYIYKKLPKQAAINRSQLKVLVTENGQMQLASVYYGSTPIKHSSIRATLPDKSKAETLVIGYDGANNYRFTNDGKYTEIVTYKDGQCSAVAAIIANNTSKKITLTYLGGNRYTLSLDPVTREAVKATRELANLMKNVDDLKREYQLNVRTLELADKQVLQLEKQQSEQNAE
ncbi:hypothetical protein PL418_02100 [Barnesiella intestinihominis]|uniref:hypothetical protein n=1 Tax=Barnesiella intestinihominis TaxID=487174 RepID=UPI00189A46AC|nr:hypothetical protein [Barnesiella intestinihominis]MDB0680365.1 hypothetical protein [Barnesiella intestinihominis]